MARKKKTEEVVEEVKVEETPVVEEAQGEVLNEVVEAPAEVVEEEPKVEEVVEETPAPKKSRKKKVVEEVVEETPEEVTADPANDSDVVVPAKKEKKVVSAPIKVGSRVKIKKGVTSWYTGAVIDPISRDSAFYVKLLTNYNTAVISIAPGKGSYLIGEILLSHLELC